MIRLILLANCTKHYKCYMNTANATRSIWTYLRSRRQRICRCPKFGWLDTEGHALLFHLNSKSVPVKKEFCKYLLHFVGLSSEWLDSPTIKLANRSRKIPKKLRFNESLQFGYSILHDLYKRLLRFSQTNVANFANMALYTWNFEIITKFVFIFHL